VSVYGAHPLSDGQKNEENEKGLAEGVSGVKESWLIFLIFCGGFRSTGSGVTVSRQTAVWLITCEPSDINVADGEQEKNGFCKSSDVRHLHTHILLWYQNRIMKRTFSLNDPQRPSNLGSRGTVFLEETARPSVGTGCFADISRGLKQSRLEIWFLELYSAWR